jgi:hypothetical protein
MLVRLPTGAVRAWWCLTVKLYRLLCTTPEADRIGRIEATTSFEPFGLMALSLLVLEFAG